MDHMSICQVGNTPTFEGFMSSDGRGEKETDEYHIPTVCQAQGRALSEPFLYLS